MRFAPRALVLCLFATASLAQAAVKVKGPSITKMRAAIRQAANEPWVDGHMRKFAGEADKAVGKAIRTLGGLQAAKKRTSSFMGVSTSADFPNGVSVNARLDAGERGGGSSLNRDLSLWAGSRDVTLRSGQHTTPNGLVKSVSAGLKEKGNGFQLSRMYLPKTSYQAAQIVSEREIKRHERGGGGFEITIPNVKEKNGRRALDAQLAVFRGYADAASRTGKREIRAVLRRVDALLASPNGKWTHRVTKEFGMNGITVEFPSGARVFASASDMGTLTLELHEGGVERRINLNETVQSGSVTTTRPRAYAAGMGESKREVHLSDSLMPNEDVRMIDRTFSLTRPVK